ncbi:hypothetical protein THER_1695 [Thermodesulfovibrio sp. N1]|nr:hypothetical protein [Thermodesulfovibrio sp. 1176]ODA43579.1 hypothetical protein THER_1695 [Thermodesulfovibrio sp. N1]
MLNSVRVIFLKVSPESLGKGHHKVSFICKQFHAEWDIISDIPDAVIL